MYKDLGIATENITRWTSLIALPWGLQMLLGPFVDLNFTKRRWILGGQLVIALGIAISAFIIKLPQAFEFSLIVFGVTALFSALTNIATDGFALLAMTKSQQAAMAGFMSTFYRLGRLFCASALVYVVGRMTTIPPLRVDGDGLAFRKNGQLSTTATANLTVIQGLVGDPDRGTLEPEMKVPAGTYGLTVSKEGEVTASASSGKTKVGQIPGTLTTTGESSGSEPKKAWFIVMLVAVGVYVFGRLANQAVLPSPAADVERDQADGETGRNLRRAGTILALGLSGYFLLSALVRIGAHTTWMLCGGDPAGTLKGWMLPSNNLILGVDLGLGGLGTELISLVVCAGIFMIGLGNWRKRLVHSEMGQAILSYVQQPGFGAIFFFIVFYRFPEAMVGKITPLFLKDSLDKGGLAIPNDQLGVLSGFLGIVGIILGGIVGGLTVSKIGLRKSFLPLALAMHVPNLLYLGLFYHWLPMVSANVPILGLLNMTLGGVIFMDQFGYGFGFAGYMVYLMWVAQRGQFVTSHYAIGTGFGALTIAGAGVLSGVVYSAFEKTSSYGAVFIAVIILSIPGLISLLLIPLDDSHKSIKVEVE